ncbi:MAG: hypothetical protein ABIT96_01210 [Ferruginibacter sp.]
MKDFDNLKSTWQQTITGNLPSAEDAASRNEKLSRQLKQQHVKEVITYFLTGIFLIPIHIITSGQIATSIPGLVILLASAFGYAFVRLFLLYRLRHINMSDDSSTLLKKLNNYSRLHLWVLQQGQFVYSLFLTIGVFLYLWPVIIKINWPVALLICATYLGWAAYYSFYIRGREAEEFRRKIKSMQKSFGGPNYKPS